MQAVPFRSPSLAPLRTSSARHGRSRGQSIVEFALVLPLLVGIFGSVGDFARVYQGWITLQGATRSAAEIAATQATSSTQAATLASTAVCAELSGVSGFAGTATSCTNPTVTVISFSRSSSAPGASTKYPLATVTVQSRFEFHTLFAYPGLTDNGNWVLQSEASYSIFQNR